VVILDYTNRYNAKIKIYPDGNFKATYCNKAIFKQSTPRKSCKNDMPNFNYNSDTEEFELEEPVKSTTALEPTEDKKSAEANKLINIERSISRAKSKLFDIIYVNDFKYFVTINFDTKKVNSRNAKEVMAKLIVWLNHQQQRKGMEYILVPEYHNKSYDGVTDRIHCHMLITDYPQHLLVHAVAHTEGGGIKRNKNGSPKLLYNNMGQPVYNMLGWQYGFSTCIPVYRTGSSNLKLAHYVTKYVTKDIHQIFGKYYWSSKGLKREVDTSYFDCDYASLPLKEYEVPKTSIKLKYDSQFDFVMGAGNNNGME
jgi:hypothetical protein